jgi:hypothetical protein
MTHFNKYRNKQSGEIIEAELRITEKINWNLHHVELYISNFKSVVFTSLESFNKEFEEVKNETN